MRMTSILTALLFGLAVPVLARDALVPVAMCTGPDRVWAAYVDHAVWRFEHYGSLEEVHWANRGIPILALTSYSQSSPVYILCDDNQVWLGNASSGSYSGSVSRPDQPSLRPIHIGIHSSSIVVSVYEDWEVWSLDDCEFRREMGWERLNPAALVSTVAEHSSLRVFPNPALGSCRIAFEIIETGAVSVRICDASGRIVRSLLEQILPAGGFSLEWDRRDASGHELPSGVYLVHLETQHGEESGRVVLSR